METSAVSTTPIPFTVTPLFTSKWKGRDISLIAAGVVVAFALFIALLYYFSRDPPPGDNGPNPGKSNITLSKTGPSVNEVD